MESASLGGRLPLLGLADLSPAQREIHNQMTHFIVPWAQKGGFESTDGGDALIGPFNAFLYTPEIADAYLRLIQAEWEHSTLSARVREIIILTVGARWQSAYEIYAHTAVGKSAGLDDAVISAILSNDEPPGLTSQESIAHRVVGDMCTHHRIEPSLYAEAEEAFGAVGLVNIFQLAGMYLFIATLLNGFEVPAPAH